MLARSLLLLLSATLALGSPIAQAGSDAAPKCEKPAQRKAWQNLSVEEKKAYIDAELCLMSKPAQLENAVTRFEDLVKPHQVQGFKVHGTGYFLPFHRILMQTHEILLKTECGYKGVQPYWAEEVDAGAVEKSDVVDPITGFGGNGAGPDGCIQDGPFKDYILHTGPGLENNPHCITRRFSNPASLTAAKEFSEWCDQYDRFEEAWQCLENGGPHNGFHGGVGGDLLNPLSSPGDPLFYLHHTWLDKIWWDWQKKKPSRLMDVSGRKAGFLPGFGGTPPPGLADFIQGIQNGTIQLPGGGAPGGFPGGFPGGPGGPPGNFSFPGNFTIPGGLFGGGDGKPSWRPPASPEVVEDPVTLEDTLDMFGIIPNVTVRDVMDIKGGVLCYEYVEYEAPTY